MTGRRKIDAYLERQPHLRFWITSLLDFKGSIKAVGKSSHVEYGRDVCGIMLGIILTIAKMGENPEYFLLYVCLKVYENIDPKWRSSSLPSLQL